MLEIGWKIIGKKGHQAKRILTYIFPHKFQSRSWNKACKQDYLMFMAFISAILALSVHWFLGVANFIIAYAYIVEA
ncbi:MAG: hypothetical protein AABX01_06270 [Candidatus Micrarchaeota archaeon]